MYIRPIAILIIVLISSEVKGQVMKIDNGIAFSSYHNNSDLSFLSSKKQKRYSVLLGADYLEKKFFNLSSQAGFLTLGGKEENTDLPDPYRKVSESKGFIHANTTAQFFIRRGGIKYFLGAGPYANMSTGDRAFSNTVYPYTYQRFHWGAKTDLGIAYDTGKYRVGMNAVYLLNLSPVAKSSGLSLYNNPISANLSLGFKLR